MKIGSGYNRIDLFCQENKKEAANGNTKNTMKISQKKSVQVDISKEGIERSRDILGQREMDTEDGKECHILIDHGLELSAKMNQIADSKKDFTVKDCANNILEAYASLYHEIVQGYEDGTRVVYAEAGEDRILTKEEDLERLNEAYKSHVRYFEERVHMEQKNNAMQERSIRGTAWEHAGGRAKQYLNELDEKKQSPEYIPSNMGERLEKAGEAFAIQFSALKNEMFHSVADILSFIKL